MLLSNLFFFKQKPAYEMRIIDWSSDVCSSDLSRGVRLVAQRAGRADEVVDPVGVQLSEFEVDLKPMNASKQDATLQRIRNELASFPGISTSVNTFLVERIDETISGSTADRKSTRLNSSH